MLYANNDLSLDWKYFNFLKIVLHKNQNKISKNPANSYYLSLISRGEEMTFLDSILPKRNIWRLSFFCLRREKLMKNECGINLRGYKIHRPFSKNPSWNELPEKSNLFWYGDDKSVSKKKPRGKWVYGICWLIGMAGKHWSRDLRLVCLYIHRL